MHAVALHKCVLMVASSILQLCLKIAGEAPALRGAPVCSIESTIAACVKVLERLEAKDMHRASDAYRELSCITQLLVPEDKENAHDWMEGLYPGRVYEPHTFTLCIFVTSYTPSPTVFL